MAFIVTPAGDARAQSGAASAEALFAEGRRLMGEGKTSAACTKFAASNKLDPSSGTLLNLGSCYEKLGRTASAWATYQEAASLAQSADRQDHLRIAQKRAVALEPTLPKVTVKVSEPVDGLEIRRDGVLVTAAEWDLAVPIDPGPHTYVAKAPQHETWTSQVNVEATADPTVEDASPAKVMVTIPPLKQLAPVPGQAGGADAKPQERDFWNGRHIVGVAAAGVGVVGLALGSVFGLLANSKYNDSLTNCPKDKNLCTPLGVDQRDDARTQGNIATVGFIVGAVGLATGLVLLLPIADGAGKRASVELSPTPSGMIMRGRW